MQLLTWILIFSLIGGVLSVLIASLFLLLNNPIRLRLIPHLVSFAIGSLLGAAFLGLLPHALELVPRQQIHQLFMVILLGLLVFFLLEKLLLWRHCHSDHCEAHDLEETDISFHNSHTKNVSGSLIIIGDAVHNFIDGILIAAAFLTDIHLGIVTALAIAAHEIPQEVGNFAVLLHSGYSRGKAYFYNMLSSLTTIIGAIFAYYSLAGLTSILPYCLAIAASSFIYIAVADLIPGLHKKIEIVHTIQQVALIGLGVTVIYVSHAILH